MSVTYFRECECGVTKMFSTFKQMSVDQQLQPPNRCGIVKVQEFWNGHWLRPCVGMRGEQASHVVDSKDFEGRDWYLVARQDACMHVWSVPGVSKTSSCLFCQKVRSLEGAVK